MTPNSTQLDMIAYLYGESTPAQTRATERALAADPVLRGELTELTVSQASVPRLRFSAPKRILRIIRDYAAGPDLQLSV